MATRRTIAALILWIVTICSSAASADAIRLEFRPEIGKKQTMRITSHVATTPSAPAGQDITERHWILTVELEPLAVAADGAVTIRVTILRIQHKLFTSRKGREAPIMAIDLDSTDEKRRYEHEMGMCLAPIGESFTVIVSAQGRVREFDTEAFCAAVGRKRMQYEDEAIRRKATRRAEWRSREEEDEEKRQKLIQAAVEQAIRDENRKYGSAARRERIYREGALESHLYSMVQLRWLLNDLLIPFPAEPVAEGGRWTAPVMFRSDGPIELSGTYTLKGRANDTCTIRVEAHRTMDDQSIGAPPVPEGHRTRLAGTYRATVTIDRTTGAVLSKEASMDLTGRTSTYMPDIPREGTIVQISMKTTATVEELRDSTI